MNYVVKTRGENGSLPIGTNIITCRNMFDFCLGFYCFKQRFYKYIVKWLITRYVYCAHKSN